MQHLADGPLSRLLAPGSELWLDGGHNPAGGQAIAQTLADMEERSPKPVGLVLGMMGNKDAPRFLAHFGGLVRRIATVPISGAPEAAHEPAKLAALAEGAGFTAEPAADVESAIRRSAEGRRRAAAHPDLRLAVPCRPGARPAGRRAGAGQLTSDSGSRDRHVRARHAQAALPLFAAQGQDQDPAARGHLRDGGQRAAAPPATRRSIGARRRWTARRCARRSTACACSASARARRSRPR